MVVVVLGQDREQFRERHGAIADGAADQAKAFVGALRAIVLQMDVAHIGRDGAGEVERRLGHREGVAGVEDDADGGAEFVAERHQFAAGEILVVLDRRWSARRPAAIGA